MRNYELLSCFLILSIVTIFVVLYPLRKSRGGFVQTLIFALVLLVMPLLGYYYWGAGFEWRGYQQELAKQEQVKALLKTVQGSPQALITKLKARLAQQPESARGWYLLGRLYASQEDWQQAYSAYAKAYQLDPMNEGTAISYAQSLWQLNHQQFNDNIRGLFQSVLHKNANQPDALAMLAMDAFLGHAYKQAIDYWQRLLNILPPQSEDALAIRKAIAKAQQMMS